MNHCGSSWRLRGTTRSCGGLPGTVKAYLGALEANPGAEEDDHGAVEAYPIAVNAHIIQYVYSIHKKVTQGKCGTVVEWQIGDMKDIGSSPVDAAFKTFQLCRRSSIFVKSIGEVRWSSSKSSTWGMC
jgi:hypothetical protein